MYSFDATLATLKCNQCCYQNASMSPRVTLWVLEAVGRRSGLIATRSDTETWILLCCESGQ